MQAYDAVTTQGGKYVQGGGCTTVGVAGLIQGGGFGSFSKHYGLTAGSLLEAEVVTADGKIRSVGVFCEKSYAKKLLAQRRVILWPFLTSPPALENYGRFAKKS
jgi:FAD/FMN-containing dehydrogenase